MREIVCSTGEIRNTYKAYLHTNHWLNKRSRILLERGKTCQDCHTSFPNNKSLAIHHLTYERIGNEDDGDLVVLCHPCHGKRHPDKVAAKKAKKALQKTKPRKKKKAKKKPKRRPMSKRELKEYARYAPR
jgi:hypothetical protein